MRQSGVEDDPSTSTGEPSASSHSPVVKLSSRIAAGIASDRRILYWLRLKFAKLSRARQRLVACRLQRDSARPKIETEQQFQSDWLEFRVAMASGVAAYRPASIAQPRASPSFLPPWQDTWKMIYRAFRWVAKLKTISTQFREPTSGRSVVA